MDTQDFYRLNRAAKSIEADSYEAYHSVKGRCGSDVAGALVILFLRLRLNPEQIWPAPESVEEEIEQILRKQGILRDSERET